MFVCYLYVCRLCAILRDAPTTTPPQFAASVNQHSRTSRHQLYGNLPLQEFPPSSLATPLFSSTNPPASYLRSTFQQKSLATTFTTLRSSVGHRGPPHSPLPNSDSPNKFIPLSPCSARSRSLSILWCITPRSPLHLLTVSYLESRVTLQRPKRHPRSHLHKYTPTQPTYQSCPHRSPR